MASSKTCEIYQGIINFEVNEFNLLTLRGVTKCLVYILKAGNPTATLICLCALRDMDLDDKIIQIAIKESGGLQVLLNMLDTEEDACKQAALIIVRQITQNKHIRRNVFNMRVSILT